MSVTCFTSNVSSRHLHYYLETFYLYLIDYRIAFSFAYAAARLSFNRLALPDIPQTHKTHLFEHAKLLQIFSLFSGFLAQSKRRIGLYLCTIYAT